MGTKLSRKQIKDIVDNLHTDTVDATPQDFDFGEGYGEKWETVEPDLSAHTADELKSIADDHGIDIEPIPVAEADDDGAEIEEWKETARGAIMEGLRDNGNLDPMMNYLYPVDGCRMSAEGIQAAILGTSLVAVTVDGATFLALAGGGMDFSWQICEAYVLIGMCPPLHFRPPMSCDDPDSDRTRLVIAAYLKSCNVAIDRARWSKKDILHTAKALREHQAERIARDEEAANQRAKAERKAGKVRP